MTTPTPRLLFRVPIYEYKPLTKNLQVNYHNNELLIKLLHLNKFYAEIEREYLLISKSTKWHKDNINQQVIKHYNDNDIYMTCDILNTFLGTINLEYIYVLELFGADIKLSNILGTLKNNIIWKTIGYFPNNINEYFINKPTITTYYEYIKNINILTFLFTEKNIYFDLKIIQKYETIEGTHKYILLIGDFSINFTTGLYAYMFWKTNKWNCIIRKTINLGVDYLNEILIFEFNENK